MLILNSPEIAQATCLRWKTEGKIAFVPTMGCLHAGHVALIRLAKSLAERTVVSIFVNPLQFGPNEDMASYPRPYETDQALLREEGVDLLVTPSAEELYPQSFQCRVQSGMLATHLCGASRPGHFDGVLTVVLKFFSICQPDIAIFGEKDFQQLTLIQQMVNDFNLPVSVISHPTVREENGLALSSRNCYLLPDERALAPRIHQALLDAQRRASLMSVDAVSKLVREKLGTQFQIDYISVCAENDLIPQNDSQLISAIERPRLFVAARLDKARLIDNISLMPNEKP